MSVVALRSSEIELLLHLNQFVNYFDPLTLRPVVPVVILAYDYILTLPGEVKLMWGTPWGIGRILFTLTRYSAFLECIFLTFLHFAKSDLLSHRTVSTLLFRGCIFVGVAVAEAVFIFRTYAIWKQSSKILWFFGCVLGLIGIPGIYLTHISVSRVRFGTNPLPSGQSCFVVESKRSSLTLLWDYALTLIFETLILVLTLVPGLRHPFSIGNVICLGAFQNTTGATLVLLQRVLHSVLTSRILLHIRHAGAKDRQEFALSGVVDWYPQGQISTVVFGVETLFGYDSRSTLARIHEVEGEHC
ncbi:hypothetical protein BU17DRAFT_60469 [Hysterangium stoloniferum]|nr:hypothetical protein BU17DRAFT_60469 [Hysterangium stoloniferum]